MQLTIYNPALVKRTRNMRLAKSWVPELRQLIDIFEKENKIHICSVCKHREYEMCIACKG